MFKWVSILISILFSASTVASINLNLACKEKKEQQMSLLTEMSTSVSEAHLAGQCTGYWSFEIVPIKESCSEFVEQKNALLPAFSTSVSEAHYAGICVGVIYRIAQNCGTHVRQNEYLRIAENASSLEAIRERLSCYGG
ncbi:hypothetical protein [Psychromonas sp. MME2]|uniref:hypothetical protein n=1 Tax=unclassified Psychromonas TaxID=2614957 RepID=UPI00339C50EF